jgi:hypothetical protein
MWLRERARMGGKGNVAQIDWVYVGNFTIEKNCAWFDIFVRELGFGGVKNREEGEKRGME